MHLQPQRYRVPEPENYPFEIDLLLAAGQVLLRSSTHSMYEFRGPLEMYRLIESRPSRVAHYGKIPTLALPLVFPAPGSSPLSGWRRRLRLFWCGGLVRSREQLCLSIVRGLLEEHPYIFAWVHVRPGQPRQAQLFAALAAAMVLEGEPDLEIPIRDFMRLCGLSSNQWSGGVRGLLESIKGPDPPYGAMALEPGQTELDYRFYPNVSTLKVLGFSLPVPRHPRPKPAAGAPPAAKTPPSAPSEAAKKEKEPEPSICTFEETAALPGLHSLVVAPDLMEELRYAFALCSRAVHRGKAAPGPPSTPPRLLFHGPPGTGKTHAARALAHDVGRPLAVVLPGALIQKWVGETEKAIERAFREAAERGAMLFLDEADSFLHDRRRALQSYELSCVNALLNQLDRTTVPVILCTNLLDSLDPAVHRRMDHMLEFPLPGLTERRILWEKELLRAQLGVARPDCDRLAQVPLSGGLIHNAVAQASRRRLVQGEAYAIDTEGLLALAERELPKMGDFARPREPIGFSAPLPVRDEETRVAGAVGVRQTQIPNP